MAKKFIVHNEEGIKYYVWLREIYSDVTSEKKLMDMLEKAISYYENKKGFETYGKALRTKRIFELCSIFGITSKKMRLERR